MSEKAFWEGKHFAFHQNRECEYFPCHKTDKPEEFSREVYVKTNSREKQIVQTVDGVAY